MLDSPELDGLRIRLSAWRFIESSLRGWLQAQRRPLVQLLTGGAHGKQITDISLFSSIRFLDVIPIRIMLGTPPSRFNALGRGVAEASPLPASLHTAVVVYVNVGARRL